MLPMAEWPIVTVWGWREETQRCLIFIVPLGRRDDSSEADIFHLKNKFTDDNSARPFKRALMWMCSFSLFFLFVFLHFFFCCTKKIRLTATDSRDKSFSLSSEEERPLYDSWSSKFGTQKASIGWTHKHLGALTAWSLIQENQELKEPRQK